MADNKKYYYLKLKENFFDSDSMVLLESMQDGILYSNILMKMYLKSLKNNGKLVLNDAIPYNTQMIATVTRHQVGTVEKAIEVFEQLGLIDILDGGTIYMSDIELFVGKSSTEGDRKRAERMKLKHVENLALGQMSDIHPPEIEIDIDIEKEIRDIDNIYDCAEAQKAHKKQVKKEKPTKHKYGESNNVLLTDDELDKLKDKFPDWEDRIERLSGYVESKGAKYKSHYATIINWARREGGTGRTAIKSSIPKNTGYAPEQDMNDLDDLF